MYVHVIHAPLITLTLSTYRVATTASSSHSLSHSIYANFSKRIAVRQRYSHYHSTAAADYSSHCNIASASLRFRRTRV
jgi:hypothetical protein